MLSRKVQKLTPNDWYYERPDGIHIHHEVFDIENRIIRNDEIIISWRRLIASVRRKLDGQKPAPKRDYGTAKEIEIQIAYYFGIRTHVCVPNVSWGLLPYEADLLILHQSGYVDEVEIKVSRSDLIKDKEKYHWHDSNRIRRLWFAIPAKLEKSAPDIPERAGVLVVGSSGYVKMVRRPTINKIATKFTDAEKFNLARLGTMRIWHLKRLVIDKGFSPAGEYIDDETTDHSI